MKPVEEPFSAELDSSGETYAEAMVRVEHLHRRLVEVIDNEFNRIASALAPSSVTERDVIKEIHTQSSTSLTPRQRQVMELLVEGKSNKEIARSLSLGEGTVKIHMAALFRNLGVTNRARAAVVGAQIRSKLQPPG
jgi:DNA-binding NarL/FixJ family response regulator